MSVGLLESGMDQHIGLGILLARLVNAHDVRMLQPCRRLHLRAKSQRLFPAGELTRENHFYGDQPVQLSLARLEDDAHSAARDFLQQFVVAKMTSGSTFGCGRFESDSSTGSHSDGQRDQTGRALP